jgi:hypothetical protein
VSPFVAVHEGRRVVVTEDGPTEASCPGCEGPMRAKRGDLVVWHWAHKPDPNRECYHEGETAWHLGWKARADDPARVEVSVGRRRADVLTPYGWAVEFQHSPLTPHDVTSRESDWGRRMVWLWDGLEAHESGRLQVYKREAKQTYFTFAWSRHKSHVVTAAVPTFLHVREESLLFVGRWYEKRDGQPIRGYGWRLSADDFAANVINGTQPPNPPRYGEDIAPAQWSRPPSEPAPVGEYIQELGGFCPGCGRFICECAPWRPSQGSVA